MISKPATPQMTDASTKPATEAEVQEAATQSIMTEFGMRRFEATLLATSALTAARAKGCLMPEEAAALRESIARLGAKADNALQRRDEKARALDDMAAERNAGRAQIAARLKVAEDALRGLIDLQEQTEMTYEDAYHAMFKRGDGRDAWNAARAALTPAPSEVGT